MALFTDYPRIGVLAHTYQKQLANQSEKARALYEAETFQNYLELLVSLHKDCGAPWNWPAYEGMPAPAAPFSATRNEAAAVHALKAYDPGFFDKLFGGAKKRVAELEADVTRGQIADQSEYSEALRQHHDEWDLWNWRRALASRIGTADPAAYPEALEHAGAFQDVAEFKAVRFIEAGQGGVVQIACLLSDDEIVPTEEVKLTATGKLSSKTMPAGRYWALYQDYVCSAAIRLANETFAVLPIDRAIVNVGVNQTNASTGHREQVTFLAVHFDRDSLRRLNLNEVDPSEAMKNFPHRMKFKKTTGFEGVSPMTAQEQWISASS